MRRPTLFFLMLLLAVAFSTVTVIVRAQDGTTVDDDLTSQLPIAADVQYVVGTGDNLDSIAALFDVDLACLIETNSEVITGGDVIYAGDTLLISTDCPVYIGVGFVPFRREVEQGGGGGTYTVRVADTLDEIAFAFDVSVEALAEFNEIDNPLEIFPGDVLQIPPTAPPYGQVPARPGAVLLTEQGGGESGEDGITYVIQPGDTIDAIGAFFDKSSACIIETNNVQDTRNIQPRDLLYIPAGCPPYDGSGIVRGTIIPVDADTTGDVIATVEVVTVTPAEVDATATPEILEIATEEAGPATATEIVVPTVTPTVAEVATEEAAEVETEEAAAAEVTEATEEMMEAMATEEMSEEMATEEAMEEMTEEATEETEPDSDSITVAPPVIGATATQIPTLAATATATSTVGAPATTPEVADPAAASPTAEVLSSSSEASGEANNFIQGFINQAGSAVGSQ